MGKMTKKERYTETVKILNTLEKTPTIDELVKGFNHDIEVLNNRSTSPSKNKKVDENNAYRDRILEMLKDAGVKGYSIADFKAKDFEMSGWNGSQKLSGLLKPLVDNGKVERFHENRVTRYRLTEFTPNSEE